MLEKKIAFFCKENDSFINPIINYLGQKYGDRVEITKHGDCQPPQFFEILNKVDLAWLEWLSDWCVGATSGDKYSKLFIRMHSYEAFNLDHKNSGHVQNVNWNQIDELIIPNRSVMQVVNQLKNFIAEDMAATGGEVSLIKPNIDSHKINVIPNPVDCTKYRVANSKGAKKLCWIGYINYKKNFELALYLFKQLLAVDPTWEFHIAGTFQDPRHRLYFEWFTRDIPKNNQPNARIFYYGWVPPEHMNKWLEDKSYIVSSSLYESFHYGLAEGMTAGLIPLIHHWFGADALYPEKFMWDTVPEAVKLVNEFEDMNEDTCRQLRFDVRRHIVDNYSYDKVMPIFKNLIDSHLYEKELIKFFNGDGGIEETMFDLDTMKDMFTARGKINV